MRSQLERGFAGFKVLGVLCALCGLILSGREAAAAEPAAWNHLHLTCTNQKEAAEWYAKHMEGRVVRFGGLMDLAVFGQTSVAFFVKPEGFAGSAGSTVDHVGWSFADLDAKMKEFEAAGIKILSKPISLGKIKFAFNEDKWGTKIEV